MVPLYRRTFLSDFPPHCACVCAKAALGNLGRGNYRITDCRNRNPVAPLGEQRVLLPGGVSPNVFSSRWAHYRCVRRDAAHAGWTFLGEIDSAALGCVRSRM